MLIPKDFCAGFSVDKEKAFARFVWVNYLDVCKITYFFLKKYIFIERVSTPMHRRSGTKMLTMMMINAISL